MQRATRPARLAIFEGQDGLAYVVRMWQVRSEGRLVWRASAASRTGERRAFADLPALFAFLEGETVDFLSHAPLESCLRQAEPQNQVDRNKNLKNR